MNLMHRINRSDVDILREIGFYMAEKKEYTVATQVFRSINDIRSLLKMHVNVGQWDDVTDIFILYFNSN